MHSSFCELARATVSLPLCPPPPTVRAVCPTPPAQGRGQCKACWDGNGGWETGDSLASCHLPLVAWPDWGQSGRLLCLRLMRTGLWSWYRMLQYRRPAGRHILPSLLYATSPSTPQPSVLALSELLIVLMNILEASRNGSSGLGVWFHGP